MYDKEKRATENQCIYREETISIVMDNWIIIMDCRRSVNSSYMEFTYFSIIFNTRYRNIHTTLQSKM